MSTFFILSSERSGTNLLRSLLASHSKIAAPPPAPIMAPFQDRAYLYHGLEEHPSPLIEDLQTLLSLEGSAYRWEWVPDAKQVRELARGSGVIPLIASFYRAYADHFGCEHVLSKESQLFRIPYLLEQEVDDAYFIYLVRDGRDVALSERKAPSKKRPVFLLAERWRDEQIACSNAYHTFLDKGRAIFIRYEDLLDDPEGTMERLLGWAGLPMEENVFEYHQDEELQRQASRNRLWGNLNRPLMQENKAKYKEGLSKAQVALFEKVAGEFLLRSGYQLEGRERMEEEVGRVTELYYRTINKLDKWISGRDTRAQEKGVRTFLEKRASLFKLRRAESLKEKSF